MDRPSRPKINRETSEIIDTIDQNDLIGIFRIFHPTSVQCTFFPAPHGILSKIDHILGHKASLTEYKELK
jgi:hypothetical protein